MYIGFVLTLAKSILSVQHPEYMSAPLRVSLALVAASKVSNVLNRTYNIKVKDHHIFMYLENIII